ncbi:MAG TPA: hypothetical protein VGC03_08735 [Acidimicrobiia bacterium]|jgi:hypothetical protein
MRSWWRVVAAYPATWLAMGLVVLGTWAILALLQPPFFMTVILLIIAGLAIASWPITMSATGMLNRLQSEVSKLSEVETEELARLEAELKGLEDTRPLRQLKAIQEKRDSLVGVLNRRLESGELTYGRYLSTAQGVYLATLENLREVAVAVDSVSAIDDDYIVQRLDELADLDDDAAKSERGSLQDRRALLHSQEKKIAALLSENESAMTMLDRTTTALADAPIGRQPQDAKAAMAALQELADRAERYVT